MNYPSFSRQLIRAALAALTLALPALANAQNTYTITDIGTLGGTFSYAFSINAAGQTTGYSYLAGNSAYHAFRYSSPTLTDLGTLGGKYSVAYGSNASGQVAGYSNPTGSVNAHACRSVGAALTDLGTLGGNNSVAYGINASGQVTGYSYLADNATQHAFRVTGTIMTDIGTLGGATSVGQSINDSGTITGYSSISGNFGTHAFLYDATGIHDLGTLGGTLSQGNGINAGGQVTGWAYMTGNAIQHATRWTGTTVTDLGSLGGTTSQGDSINSSGTVVGYSTTANGGQVAFIAAGNKMIDLNTLLPAGSGWILTEATSINDNGWICGTGQRNGQQSAFLLKPVSAAISGRLAIQGVPDMTKIKPGSLQGSFHFSFRAPGTTTELFGYNSAITVTADKNYGSYTLANVPAGIYDIGIHSLKNLRTVLGSVNVGGTSLVPDATLLAGDANTDNLVDIGDFGVLVNSYNGDITRSGSGYNPAADFDYNGVIDVGDLGLLVNNYGALGMP